MFSPLTPGSSPLAHLSSKAPTLRPQLFQPTHSSPLSGSSSPTHAPQARRKRQYKSQDSSRIAAPNLFSAFEDTPQKQFLRDRFRARCLERAKEGRARAIRKRRASSVGNGSSSDGFDGDGDFSMDDEGLDEGLDDEDLDDELYQRVMLNDQLKAQHAKRVSFERDFGSSIDPSMHEDMETLEWELTGKASTRRPLSPEEEDLEDALIQEYLAELEESEWQNVQEVVPNTPNTAIELKEEDPGDLEREFTTGHEAEHPSPSLSMFSDFQMSSPPSSPSRSSAVSPSQAPHVSTWNCPFCSESILRTQVACSMCATQYPLDPAQLAWMDAESHSAARHEDHVPLATRMPQESGVGVVMLCGAPGCDWCFAL